ncbi:hypothetical protein K469DRAFT_718827 [Zopfia rhizophila CBS 207.26]|uniref:Protein kinase domain-containing protein n=1 Tax=Zopfia rhizophila CBS 207.26 TaxID=1314779 RepID=A0A6A6EM40_9PEZI|nr:hypothetical protein K469DRAFT_718827 [Zopfia rhizophila CBS 207.26]
MDVRALADFCGWQIGDVKFLEKGTSGTRFMKTQRERFGHGRNGEVEKVENPCGNFATVARKELPISFRRAETAWIVNIVENEISSLRKLDNFHIVEIIG